MGTIEGKGAEGRSVMTAVLYCAVAHFLTLTLSPLHSPDPLPLNTELYNTVTSLLLFRRSRSIDGNQGSTVAKTEKTWGMGARGVQNIVDAHLYIRSLGQRMKLLAHDGKKILH